VQQPPPSSPIIIRIAEEKSELQGLSDILLGSLGLAGAFILGAALLALIFAGALYLWRSRAGAQELPPDDLHVV
jgi:hypothetical protein